MQRTSHKIEVNWKSENEITIDFVVVDSSYRFSIVLSVMCCTTYHNVCVWTIHDELLLGIRNFTAPGIESSERLKNHMK